MADCKDAIDLSINESRCGERLDTALLEVLESAARSDEELGQWFSEQAVTRSKLSRWISQGFVLNEQGGEVKAGQRIKRAVTLRLLPPVEAGPELEPDPSVKLNIVYEDGAVLVLNKQAGLVVHPGAGNANGTLVNGLLAYLGKELEGSGGESRPGLVHRLDKDTSGLMVVAKTPRSYQRLVEQFVDRSISRTYLALVGRDPKGTNTINNPIGRDPNNRVKMACDVPGAKESITVWKIDTALKHGLLLRIKLQTGRTHQIRVHLRLRGAPVVGDPVYGLDESVVPSLRSRARAFGRQALHAAELSFIHPESGERVDFVAPMPPDMAELVEEFNS
ncbi:MAG: RluA family pseudouridine synthase [Bdellovibrionales bacterium]|nr:RluA family pseudouridine synthase [Bdellovibrionales bacterium]